MSDTVGNEIVLYTTHCPKCRVLEAELLRGGFDFSVCEDEDKMRTLGIDHLPVLAVNDELLNFPDALKYVRGVRA